MIAIPEEASSSTIWWTSALAPTSIPRVGSSRISTLGWAFSHLASIVFCWLPPESCSTGVSSDGVRIVSFCAEVVRDRSLGRAVEQPQPRHVLAQRRERDVRRDRLRHREPELPAVLREVGDPGAQRLPRRADVKTLAVELDDAAVGRRDPEQRQRDVRAAGADEAGEPQHLALAQLEAHVREHALATEAVDAQDDSPGGCGLRTKKSAISRPTISRIARLCGDLRPRPRGDQAPVAHDGHAIGDLEHLVEAMADEQHRDPGVRQSPDLLEQLRRPRAPTAPRSARP